MSKEKVLNDHINMVSANGHKKAVPIWQVKQWIEMGRFRLDVVKGNQIGYDFANHAAGVKDYQDYIAWEAMREANRKQRQFAPTPTDAGIAEAALKPKPAENQAFTQPPDGSEAIAGAAASKAAPERPEPKDVIEI